MRSNVISFKPYIMEGGADFRGIFWTDYLGISSKIQSHILPEKTAEHDCALGLVSWHWRLLALGSQIG